MTRLALLLVTCTALLAQAPEAPKASRPGATAHAPSTTTPQARLIQEVRERQEAVANLERLCDDIGPRLTGSDRLLRAHDWAEAKLRAYGLQNVHREAYDFGPSWTRGAASGRLLTHSGLRLDLAQLAWSPATRGPIRAEALLLQARTPAELDALLGRLKGKVVILGDLPEAKENPRDARARVERALQEAGIAAQLQDSDKQDGLLNMTGSPMAMPWRALPKAPVAILSRESMNVLRRLLAKGERVELELELGGTFSPKPVQAYNTLAEIPGSERPDEVVLLGAHLDSWDLGTGATDNGTGVVAVMEAARAIQALAQAGLRPRRTVRVALFTGEEQGILGSRAYAKAHEAELPKVQAALIHDLGSGRVRGWALQNREDLRPLMAKAISALQELDVKELPLEGSFDSDHAPFVRAGVPAFFAIQDKLDYFSATHHSQADTFEHVKPADLVQGATALAVTAWELATMEERLPHKGGK